MQLKIQNADRLGKVLAGANSAITSKGDNNILETSMLVQTGNGELSIIVVNTTTHQLRLSIPATIIIPGAALVPGKYWTDIINRLGDQEIALKLEGAELIGNTTDGGRHTFNLFQGDPEDFPVDFDLPPVAATLSAEGLQEAMKAMLLAATDNEQDIIFHGKDGTLTIYTSNWMTTRSRFQMTDLNFEFKFGIPKSVISGGRIPQWTGEMAIHVDQDKVAFVQGNEHLLVRKIVKDVDVDYIEEVISTQPIGRFVVGAQQLRNRVHTVAVSKQFCTLKITGKTDKNLLIQAENAGSGSNKLLVPIQGEVSGAQSEIRLDVTVFEKALKTVDGDDLQIDFVDYLGDNQTICIRLSNEANPEKRQTMLLPLQ